MNTLKKIALVLLYIAALVCVFSNLFLQSIWLSYGPFQPNPIDGHIHELLVKNTKVYVSQFELLWFPSGGFIAFLLIALLAHFLNTKWKIFDFSQMSSFTKRYYETKR